MKTTVDLQDNLVRETKELAKQRNTTFRNILESALRAFLEKQRKPKPQYTFRNHPFHGEGTQGNIQEGDWQTIRKKIYQGRGG
jgi:hypothetical protein